MDLFTLDFQLPHLNSRGFIQSLGKMVEERCGENIFPLRFASIATNKQGFACETEVIRYDNETTTKPSSIFNFRQRRQSRNNDMNVVMLIPTGIDCAIGGHAGDATPAAKTLGAVCDNLILHPNVVNASDINEQPNNTLYTEGSLICRLMMGTIGLKKIRQNRMILITEKREGKEGDWIINQTVNTVSGVRATLGIDCDEVIVLDHGLDIETVFSNSGRATGKVGNIDKLIQLLQSRRNDYDAIALATQITPHMDSMTLHHAYFQGEGPNPWGGAEAALTHTLSSILNVPTAHSPTVDEVKLLIENYGQVDPRKAAETISMTYLTCILKGLNNAPQVITEPNDSYDPTEIHVEDLDVLVIPNGCIGLPTLAALEQGIKVITVRSNTNLMQNDLEKLPWAKGQLISVENYYEAAGVIAAMKVGVAFNAQTRPMINTKVSLL